MDYFESKDFLEERLRRLDYIERFLTMHRDKSPQETVGTIMRFTISGNEFSGESLRISAKTLESIFRDNWNDLQSERQRIEDIIKSKGF